MVVDVQAFGGDPSKVTLFGEEAGGSSAHLHALMMNDALLFHNVIVQSARYDDGVLSKKQCQDQFRSINMKLCRTLKISKELMEHVQCAVKALATENKFYQSKDQFFALLNAMSKWI